MQEPYGEGSATHTGPESCGSGSNVTGEALTGERQVGTLSCETNTSPEPTPLTGAEGHVSLGDSGEPNEVRAQSKTPDMPGRLLRGNREAPVAPAVDGTAGRAGKAVGRNPAMDAAGESDVVVVPAKPSNEARRTAEETVEERTATTRNDGQAATLRTQSRAGVSYGLDGVRAAARRDGRPKFTALLHHIDLGMLRDSFFGLKKRAAPGVEGMTWTAYEEGLAERLAGLLARVHTGAHRALPSKRSYIPEADGRQRPLGIAALEDKIVQASVVQVLNAIYEEDFAGFSYGFRPGRGQHDCLDALNKALMHKPVNWVLDADIRQFFDSIDHGWMMKSLEHRIADPRILGLIQKWLKAGVMEDGAWSKAEEGTPQGSVISPLLANIFLHYAFDLWAKHWRTKKAYGLVYLVRYADDFVVRFQRKEDGERYLADLRERLRSFGLDLHPDKTRLIEFGHIVARNRRKRGESQPETFNFLGFTHWNGVTLAGRPIIWRKTITKRMTAKLKEIRAQLMRRRHEPIPKLGAWLKAVVTGYFNYHAVPGNRTTMGAFHREISRSWLHALRRRSQRSRMNWQRFKPIIKRWLPDPHTRHPYPWTRFDATYSG